MKVLLPDGKPLEFDDGERVTLLDVAKRISPRLAEDAIGGTVNGKVTDFYTALRDGDQVKILKAGSDADALFLLRHSTAHIMATAVKRLWPDAELGIGPPIADGFYYDFRLDHRITEEDFPKIEAEMRKVVDENVPFSREDLDREKALERLRGQKARFKVELVEKDLAAEKTVSFYTDGDFTDLCRGPHVPSTGRCRVFKLTSVSGAYWKGKETNPTLQRIYGTAWKEEKDLKGYLNSLEEAKKRDHRKLGRDLELFTFRQESPGMAFWQPKGATIWNELLRYYRDEHRARSYKEVRSPLIMDVSLWKKSGHYDNYRENMFFTTSEEREFAVKPMNCPGHCLIFAEGLKSYRDLPYRMTEPGHVHRNEKSGTLHGLFRVRTFTQDDAHIFCTPDQIEDIVVEVLEFVKQTYAGFGFDDYRVELSTRPEKSIGSDEDWQKAEAALANAMKRFGMAYKLNPGDGAFYGPKLDFHITDAIGRSWQCGTVQLDFSMPGRFGLEYVGADNKKHTPVMIHRAIFGSFERLVGVLTEHFAGAFPMWLSPVQARVLPITDAHHAWAKEVEAALRAAGLRAESDLRNEKVGAKVREATLQKVNYMLTVGDAEVAARTVDVRSRKGERLGAMPLEKFVEKATGEVRERYVEPVERWKRPTDETAEREKAY
ncbi:MAG TPA: threonine--tRNA ligase [Planctomycetota bacterium]|nr:threonine--tRNA ligase [Planctomycetota bacterium]